MLGYLEALLAIGESGTMSRAATLLRVSQSAISKRIRTLEAELGKAVLERDGRGIKLTPYGLKVVADIRPLVRKLKESLQQKVAEGTGVISLSISSAIIVSWGPEYLFKAQKACPGSTIDMSTYSATVSVERVRSGEHMIALCHGSGISAPDLEVLHLFDEEMVIIPAGLKPFKFPREGILKVIGPDPRSESWSALSMKVNRQSKQWGVRLEVEKTLVSFGGVTQLARAGFGHGLVPRGVAEALGIRRSAIVSLPGRGLSIPVCLLARRSTFTRDVVKQFVAKLSILLEAYGSRCEKGAS